MKPMLILSMAAVVLAAAGSFHQASAQCHGCAACAPGLHGGRIRGGHAGQCQGASAGAYYHVAYGMPVALVVPPRAHLQTHWGWGVGNTRVTAIRPQFNHNYPGPPYYYPGAFLPTPPQPSDTDQFGVYYVRGPW